MAPVALGPRIRLGPVTFTPPAVRAGRITLPAPDRCWTSMPIPDVTQTLAWQAGEYGLTATSAQTAQVTLTHRISDPAAFSAITGQLYAAGSPVGSPVTLTKSVTLVSDVITTGTSTIAAADMPTLQLRVTWHQVALGLASVSFSEAQTPAAGTMQATSGLMIAAGII